MTGYSFRLLNVFVRDRRTLSGNPLCVFEDARGLDDAAMQALALQFNLSETAFLLPSEKATARVRIFTPTFEMPFAGHPTLGTAQVVRSLRRTGDAITLEMKAGVIPVAAKGDTWTLEAGTPTSRPPEATRGELAVMLGLAEADIGPDPRIINTGSDQLVVPLATSAAVDRCAPSGSLLKRHGRIHEGRYLAYVWAESGPGEVSARFFFPKGTAVVEDPATGSACANLGGWYVATGVALPLTRRVRQGDATGRPSTLHLHVDARKRIFVSGDVVEIGRGTIHL